MLLRRMPINPRQKCALIKTLVNRARRICKPQHLHKELAHIDMQEWLYCKYYSDAEVKRVMRQQRSCRANVMTPAVRVCVHLMVKRDKITYLSFINYHICKKVWKV